MSEYLNIWHYLDILGVQINSVPLSLHTKTSFACILGFAIDVDSWPESIHFLLLELSSKIHFLSSIVNFSKLIKGKGVELICIPNSFNVM